MNNNRNFGFHRSERHAALDMAYPADDFPERGMEGARSESVGAEHEVEPIKPSGRMALFLAVLIVMVLAAVVFGSAR